MKEIVYFVTSNANKLEEARHALPECEIRQAAFDIQEIQGTREEIVQDKAVKALALLKKPCFVEDVSLCINAWKGLPGPYIKMFMHTLGAEGLWNLVKTLPDTSCEAIATIGYIEPGKDPVMLEGSVKGKLVAPRGTGGWGFNPIFLPSGSEKTYAEMGGEAKSRISHRKKALEQLHAYLKRKGN